MIKKRNAMIETLTRRYGLGILLLTLITINLWAVPTNASGPRQDSYPAPTEPIPAEPATLEAPTPATTDAYPAHDVGLDGQTPLPIGVEAGEQAPQQDGAGSPGENSSLTPEAGGRGLLFLWVGFLATFLVFLTSVVGSTILFTRRNDS